MSDPTIIRTHIDEGTSFVSSPARSSGYREIDAFTSRLVQSVVEQLNAVTTTPTSPGDDQTTKR